MITIQARYISDTENSWLLNCEGDEEWFPKSQVEFDGEQQELKAPKWLLEQKFPDENF